MANVLARFAELAARSATYQHAAPFPHIVARDVFPENTLRELVKELEQIPIAAEANFYGSHRKYRMSDSNLMPPKTKAFIELLNSSQFLQLLERLTGIPDLLPDPYLEGGGIHQIGHGGYLKIHTDFNWHRRLKLHRRVNLLIYLNEGWRDEWKGHLELWGEEMDICHVRVPPHFNQMVIFSTTDRSYHGHPDPLACPEDVWRRSIAMYYYTKERPSEDIRFGRSEMTNYRARPGEKFSGRKHHLHQLLLRHSGIRGFLKFVTGR